MAFSLIAVTLDTDSAILDVQNLSFGRPGAFILSPWDLFYQLGGTLGDHGSSRKDTWGVKNQMTESTPGMIAVAEALVF